MKKDNCRKTTYFFQTIWSSLIVANINYKQHIRAVVLAAWREHINAVPIPLGYICSICKLLSSASQQHGAGCTVTVPVITNAAALSHQNSQVLPRKQSAGCNMKYPVNALYILYTQCEYHMHCELFLKDRVWVVLLNLKMHQIPNKQHLHWWQCKP